MKEIKKMYKLMHKNEITMEQWWEFLEDKKIILGVMVH